MGEAKVAIIGPWWRPLPPIRDGAPEWVIEHTVRRLPRLRPLVLSPWHPDLLQADYDHTRYVHARNRPWERLAPRLPFRVTRRLWGTSDPNGVLYVQALRRLLHRVRPDIAVVHVLPPLSMLVRECLPRARVIHYSHTNDLQEMPDAEWKRFRRSIDGLITVCDTALHSLVERRGPLPFPARAVLNGADLEALHPANRERWRSEVRRELGLGNGPVAVFCGRLQRRKGADHLLRAFARARKSVPDAQLLVVGASTHMGSDPDPFTRTLQDLASECGPGAVRFSGYIPAPQLGRVLSAGDVGVLPSVEQEGLPLSILEFAACGMPVIASRVGGVSEVIRDGREGILIEAARVPDDLAPALTRLLGDTGLRSGLGRAARSRMEAGFGWERVARDFEGALADFTAQWETAACAGSPASSLTHAA